MRRYLTLVCLLCLAIPTGISIAGCGRNPGADYCNGLGYGLKIDDVAVITEQPTYQSLSLAFGQTFQLANPTAVTCKGTAATVTKYYYGTSNNQVLDVSSTGNLCGGTWNRNSGGGIADFTICQAPNPLPSTGNLPYAEAFATVSAQSVVSNAVRVYVHPSVTAVSLVTDNKTANPFTGLDQQCFSQGTNAVIDAQACYANGSNQQTLLCAPPSVSSANAACTMPSVTPDIVASGSFVGYSGSITGTTGQTCTLTDFNNGSSGATATVTLTADNTIAGGAPLSITTGGVNATTNPTSALLSNGTAACSGTATVTTTTTPVPSCSASIGTFSFAVANTSIGMVVVNPTTNVVSITAEQPGTTPVTAQIAKTGSSAGFFTTCPPQSISLTTANGGLSENVTQGVTQDLVTTITDTQGKPLTGIALTYQSTDGADISVGGSGAISPLFPGVASITAICQPPYCNPAPFNQTGLFGTGLPISSNPVTITTPGTASDYVWFAAPGQSQYLYTMDLLTGATGATSRLPYVPNSALMSPDGGALFFGSSHGLMTFATDSASQITQDASAPGVALAISPDGSMVLVNDQQRGVFNIINASGGAIITSFAGMGNAAAWTPDAQTLYITDSASVNNAAEGITGHSDRMYVYSVNIGWTSLSLPSSPLLYPPLPPGLLPPTAGYSLPSPLPANTAFSSTVQSPAILVPSVGAYFRGSPTVSHTWCPSGPVGDYAALTFYPLGDTVNQQNDVLASTTDGHHILGASLTAGGLKLNDIGVATPATQCQITTTGTAPNQVQTIQALTTGPWTNASLTLDPTKANATAIDQIVASPESNLVFLTYTATVNNTNAMLPYYQPNINATTSADSAAGTLGYITLADCAASNSSWPCSGSIVAPLAGAFTPDDHYFILTTAGDNLIHFIDISTKTDSQQVNPALPPCTHPSAGGDLGCTLPTSFSGSTVPATVVLVKQRSIT
jgi:hypothetical protein